MVLKRVISLSTRPEKNSMAKDDLLHLNSKLVRTLNRRDLTLLVVGSMIGSGIFFAPAIIDRQLQGASGLVLLAWIAGGALSFCGALTLAELTTMKPEAGGLYIFIRDCFGPLPAFLYGWTLFFIIYSGTAATLAAAFTDNLRRLLPMSPAEAKGVGIGFLAVLTAINVWGTRQASDVQNVVSLTKLGSLFTIGVILLTKTHHTSDLRVLSANTMNWSTSSAFGLALVSILWAYEGWQYASYSAGEARDPGRDFPHAFLVGTITVTVIYLFMNIAYIWALGADGVAQSSNVAADAVSLAVGRRSAALVVIAIAISVFGGANGLMLSNPRVFYAMARDELFFARLATVHPRFHTPVFAIVAGCAWAVLLLLTGTFENLLVYVIFAGWLFYALAAACIFVYRRRQPELPRPYHVPGYPWTPAVFVLTSAALAINTVVRKPGSSLAGLGVIALGIPAYAMWVRSSRLRNARLRLSSSQSTDR